MEILINKESVVSGRIDKTVTVVAGLGETFDIGADLGVPVVDNAAGQLRFQGEIHSLKVVPGPLGLLPF